MELVTYDDETVTIRMSRKSEFLRLYKIVPAVVQEYNKLDETIISLTEAQIAEVADALRIVINKVPI